MFLFAFASKRPLSLFGRTAISRIRVLLTQDPKRKFDLPTTDVTKEFRPCAIADSIVAPRVKIRFLNRCRTNHSSILLGHLKKFGGISWHRRSTGPLCQAWGASAVAVGLNSRRSC